MKASLEQAFRYCLVPLLRLGMPSLGLPPPELAAEQHFQQEAGNEVLKEFYLKLTPMGKLYPPTDD
ncbi:MAG: hypothetical protein V7L21_16590 [Nostoc sp.]|uniref:hypothetical protein n=1 Tax=unclassified Nostoc TaxID=2593658 RepID=UPI0025DAE326|nr:hypothetical protein [Nostoc sp. NMS9]MBN3942947.1 hypothetical protein [Nostoc sp. NMS9]